LGDKLIAPANIPYTGILQEGLACHLPKKSATAIADCLGGESNDLPTIYLVGDSHASNHYPSLQSAVAGLRINPDVKLLVDWGFINWLAGASGCGSYEPCIEGSWPKHHEFFTKNIKQGDIIVFSLFRGRIVEDVGSLPRNADLQKVSVLQSRLAMLAAAVVSSGGKLVLVDDVPMVCEPWTNYRHFILRMGQFERCSVSEQVSLRDRNALTVIYKSLAASTPRSVIYFDPHASLCGNGVCDVLDRRKQSKSPSVLYADGKGHFRPEYPRPLESEWKHFLLTVL
jgi:hypothetical protein